MSSLLWKPIFFSYIYFILFFLLNFLGTHLRTVRCVQVATPDTQFLTRVFWFLVSGATLYPEDSGYEIETGQILKSRKLEYLRPVYMEVGDPR